MKRRLTLVYSVFMLILSTGALISVLDPQYPIPWTTPKIVAISGCLFIAFAGSFMGFYVWWDMRVKKSKMVVKKTGNTLGLVDRHDYIILN